MTGPRPITDAAAALEGEVASTPLTPREQFRAELLLQLPDVDDVKEGANHPAASGKDWDGYDPAALAGWILAGVDRLAEASAFAKAAAGVEALEQDQAEMIQLAGASSTFSAMGEWHSYLSQLSAILMRNMTLAEQWDLARTLETEATRVQGVLLALVDRFPQLQAVLSEEVGRRATGLVDAAGNSLSN